MASWNVTDGAHLGEETSLVRLQPFPDSRCHRSFRGGAGRRRAPFPARRSLQRGGVAVTGVLLDLGDSSSVSLPGLLRMAFGTHALPRSCSRPARPACRVCSSSSPAGERARSSGRRRRRSACRYSRRRSWRARLIRAPGLRAMEFEISSTSGAQSRRHRLAHARFLEHRKPRPAWIWQQMRAARASLRASRFFLRSGFLGRGRLVQFRSTSASLASCVTPSLVSSPLTSIQTWRMLLARTASRSFWSLRTNFVRQNGCSIHEPQNSCRCMPA